MTKKRMSRATQKARSKRQLNEEQTFIELISTSIKEDQLTYHELFDFLLTDKKYYLDLADLLEGDMDYETNEIISNDFIKKKVKILMRIEKKLDHEEDLHNKKSKRKKVFPIKVLYTPMGNKR